MNCFWNNVFVFLIVVSVCAKKQLNENEKKDCQVNCIQNFDQTQYYDDICRNKCNRYSYTSEIDQEDIAAHTVNLPSPELYCLTKEALTVAWQPWDSGQLPMVYLIELRNRSLDWIATNTTISTNMTFTDLNPETEYQVHLWGIQAPESLPGQAGKTTVIGPQFSPWIITFPENFVPSPVSNITVKGLQYKPEGKYLATVQWIPDLDYPACHYNLVLFFGTRYTEHEFRQLAGAFVTQFKDLDFATKYAVIIRAKNGEEEESNETEIKFSTPPCLEAIGNLLSCVPDIPANLTAEENAVQFIPVKHLTYYDVTVRWDRPEYIPDYYQVALTSQRLQLNDTVNGNATKYVFKHVELGLHYVVMLKAFSAAGAGETAILHRESTHSTIADSSKFVWVITIVVVVAISLIILFGIGVCMFHRRAKRRRYERRCKYFEELDGKSPKSLDCITSGTGLILDEVQQEPDQWEIAPEKLVLQSVLGEGAFGLVRRAWLRDAEGNASTEVAVKMLKDAPSSDQIRQFMHEIEIMKTVGTHSHLVSLIGCCSRPPFGRGGNMMLVVEFCALGDLQNYLRGVWDKMTSPPEQQPLHYADLVSPTNSEGSTNLIINKLYDIDTNVTESNLKASDLLSFARQIAVGMEFLSSMKVLHRDLAARNVLVCEDKTVKIADFGLSRDVYKENMYRKSGNGKLPIRWMAIECLTHQIYTSQSDVWSFGILLWEIVTLGGNPYPSITTNALLKYLKSGYRMERPTNCGPELYNVMLSCWKLRPKDRPTFTELRKALDELLESVTTSKYLDLDVLTSTEFASFRIPFKDISTLSGKSKSKSSDVISSDRYVHPVLLNNAKNNSGNTELPIIIK